MVLATDTVIAATEAAVQADVAAGRLVALEVQSLPALFSEMGVVSLHNRTPSPMAQRAIDCVRRIAADINR